jgi:hypothetical protein
MKSLLISSLVVYLGIGTTAFAHDLSIKFSSDLKSEHIKVLESAMSEVAGLLPRKLKTQLPRDILIQVANLTSHSSIPDEVCYVTTNLKLNDKKESIKKKAFIYGMYNQSKNTLVINAPVLLELKLGKSNSKRINCQHKSLYDQAIATIIHELTHAYDFNNGRVSNSMEYIRRAGFKKGLLKVKNKNISAMRSADPYELVSIAESFAVNMEYFTMDPEFMCRKPSMFDFYARLFEVDPFPNRNCRVNNTVMLSTAAGYIPTSLDASRVYRIDYLLASAGKEAMSGFGHSMFRIVMCAPEHKDFITNRIIPATPFGKKCLEDKFYHLVVSYRANIEDARLSYMKGIFGGYPSMLFILNFSDVLDEYNRDELRDIISYPLKLSAKDREDFITKVKEEHWNYRGSYKFINNNCAVESYDLLRSSLENVQLNKKSSLTPVGVLEDLDKMEFLSIADKDVETFKAQTEQILLAYKTAFGYVPKNDKEDKASVAKFIESSTTEQRLNKFKQFVNTKVPRSDLNAELHLLKERLVSASSFSVMEQQIFRTQALKFRKLVAEKLMKADDPKVQDLIKSARGSLGKGMIDFSNAGYGIPFSEEMSTKEELSASMENSKEILVQIDQILRDFLPSEYTQIEKMEKNIKTYNTYSLEVRKEFRNKLETYIQQVLKNLMREEYTRSVLMEALSGKKESLLKVRELLGKDLVSEKEILDVKLKKFILELF